MRHFVCILHSNKIHIINYVGSEFDAMKDIMNTEEVAEAIGVHVATVRRWLNSGELPGANTPAGWRITKDDIEAWLAKYRRKEKESTP